MPCKPLWHGAGLQSYHQAAGTPYAKSSLPPRFQKQPQDSMSSVSTHSSNPAHLASHQQALPPNPAHQPIPHAIRSGHVQPPPQPPPQPPWGWVPPYYVDSRYGLRPHMDMPGGWCLMLSFVYVFML